MLEIGFHWQREVLSGIKQTTVHGLCKQFRNSCQVVTFVYLGYTLAS